MPNEKKPNRLIREKSPYLLQHAYNPVDWYPWGDEAFEKARQENKPVFLSIGYSTCHWCHVMERESFEDAEVAAYLNRHFVPVKVDREERPDVDAVYMQVCQGLTGSGGWPLTVFLTPDKTAFFAGTYYPKRGRYGRPGLMDVLASVQKLWKADKQRLVQQGARIAARLAGQARRRSPELLTINDGHTAFELFSQSFDNQYGGFGGAPKFPTPHNLMFLLRYYYHERNKAALDIALKTLRGMYRGGLFDHIGGGFSRYSTDEKWLVPHFEKMLYDNALLTLAYLEAYQLTCEPLFKTVAERTLLYIQREMTAPEGGFYSAQDADSEGEEGKYYVFRPDTVREVLGEEDGDFFCRWYGISEGGNFEGASIPNLLDNGDWDRPDPRLEDMREKLYNYRLKRTALFKDDKVLTAWNALMIAACAKAYQVLRTDAYRVAAERAALFLQSRLTGPDGRLYVRYRDGEAAGTGYLEDYAFTAWAMLTLYESTFDPAYLGAALSYAETMCRLFEDEKDGGFYLYPADGEALMLRPKETYDGAVPSGNSVAAYVLVRLAGLTAEEKWENRAERQLAFLAGPIKEYPAGRCFGLMAAQLELYPTREVICAVGCREDLNRLTGALTGAYLPDVALLVKTKDSEALLNAFVPFARSYLVQDKKSNFYVCENKTCTMPITDVAALMEKLTEKSKAPSV
jgi:uncharacterized protein YyaL (SSP411 family)